LFPGQRGGVAGTSAPGNLPDDRLRGNAARRLREEQIVEAMTELRRHHPHVFDALVTIIAHADARTLEAVAELVDFALRARTWRAAPTGGHERARARRRLR
jgi:hypothetical protein